MEIKEEELEKERLAQLKILLDDNKELFMDDEIGFKKKGEKTVWGTQDNLILRAYKLKKPLSSVEINVGKDYGKVMNFVNLLSNFLFVGYINNGDQQEFHGLIFVSRFKTLIDVALKYDGLERDTYPDLAGVLYGYHPLREIWNYCLKRGKDNLIK